MNIRSYFVTMALATLAFGQAPEPQSPVTPAATEKAKVGGRVVNAAGSPVRRASVALQSIPNFTGQFDMSMLADLKSFSAETDTEGKFSLELAPGSYSMTVQRAGYVNVAQPVVLTAGKNLTDLTVSMKQHAVIAGRVMDEYGDPFAQAQVTIFHRFYQEGRWQFLPVQMAAAGADGAFSIGGLEEGRYYISATDTQGAAISLVASPVEAAGPKESYVATYYPGVTDSPSATAVNVAVGAEIKGMDIRMRKARVFQVRGKVTAPNGAPPQGMLTLLPNGAGISSVAMLSSNMAMLRGRDGAFTFGRITPGTYVLQLEGAFGAMMAAAMGGGTPPPVGPPLTGQKIVTVTDQDVENVVLELGPGVDIKGTFRKDTRMGQTAPRPAEAQIPEFSKPAVMLELVDGLPLNPPNAQSKDDGTFELKGVARGRYRVDARGFGPSEYVKAVRYGGTDVTRKTLEIGSGGGELEILLGVDGGEVSGSVRDEKGEIVQRASVALWEPGASPDGTARYGQISVTDPSGQFHFHNLPPGEYRLAAWPEDQSGIVEAQEFRTQFDGPAKTVKLGASGKQAVDVKIVSREDMDKAIAKVP